MQRQAELEGIAAARLDKRPPVLDEREEGMQLKAAYVSWQLAMSYFAWGHAQYARQKCEQQFQSDQQLANPTHAVAGFPYRHLLH